MLRDEIEKKILLRKVFKTKQIAIKRMRIKSDMEKTKRWNRKKINFKNYLK